MKNKSHILLMGGLIWMLEKHDGLSFDFQHNPHTPETVCEPELTCAYAAPLSGVQTTPAQKPTNHAFLPGMYGDSGNLRTRIFDKQELHDFGRMAGLNFEPI